MLSDWRHRNRVPESLSRRSSESVAECSAVAAGSIGIQIGSTRGVTEGEWFRPN